MKTRVTELFGVKYPIMLSGMGWISVPKLVAAVSNAGGLGILATGVMNAAETRKAIHQTRELTDKPFGINAPLLFPGAVENVKVGLAEKVPAINFSLGKGDWIVKAAHKYGGKVIATVVNDRHAKRAQDYGSDALVVTGHEAAAHGGDATSLVLIPAIVDTVDIPVIAAGGFADGRGLMAALALGADGIAMGTRFMTTKESPLHENCKELSIEKGVDDTIYGAYFDGLGCRAMKTRAAQKAYRRGLLGLPNFPAAVVNSRDMARTFSFPYLKLLIGILLSGWKNVKQMAYIANALPAIRIATEDGETEKKGVLPVGQCTGLIHSAPTVSELLESIIAEANDVRKRLSDATK